MGEQKIAEMKADEIARELSLGLIGVKKGTEAILALIEQEQKPMVEALDAKDLEIKQLKERMQFEREAAYPLKDSDFGRQFGSR